MFLKNFLALLIAFTIFITTMYPSYATGKIDELKGSISNLDNEMDVLAKELEQITTQVETTSKKIKTIQSDLAIAKGLEKTQYDAMKTRIQYMYENGTTYQFEILLSATSIADFLKKIEYFSTVTSYDRSALQKLSDTKEQIALQEAKLKSEQDSLLHLQTTLRKKTESTSAELTALQKKLDKAINDAEKEITPIIPDNSSQSGSSQGTGTSWSDTNISVTATDIELFAALIECEAGSTHYEGMLAVASVVVNRMKHNRYPDTLRGVIYQAGQFTPAHNGKIDHVLSRGVKTSCINIAKEALSGKNNVGDCLNFRSAGSGHDGIIIGGNVFF